MSNTLGAKKLLEMLESVRSAARECVTFEDKLTYEFRLKVGRERQSLDELLTKDTEDLAIAMAKEDEEYLAAKSVHETKYARRKAQISKARSTSKDQFLNRIESHAGLLKHQLQKELLDAQSRRDNALESANTSFETYNAGLVSENERLEALVKRATRAASGHFSLPAMMTRMESGLAEDVSINREKLNVRFEALMKQAQGEVRAYSRQPLSLLFRFIPIWLWVLLCAAPFALQYFNIRALPLNREQSIWTGAAAFAVVAVLYALGRIQSKKSAVQMAKTLAAARKVYSACLENSAEQNRLEVQTLHQIFEQESGRIDAELGRVQRMAADQKSTVREFIDNKTVRVASKNEKARNEAVKAVDALHQDRVKALQAASNSRRAEWEKKSREREESVNRELANRWNSLQEQWRGMLGSVYREVAEAYELSAKLCPPWSNELLAKWKPAAEFQHVLRFGSMRVDFNQLCESLPKDPRLALPGPVEITAPLQLTHPDQASILLETGNTGREEAVAVLNNLIFRLLTLAPPGRISFTILDPVGLGQNFSGVMHLADYGERLINNRIWTQPAQIEEKLGELNDHMEKVIQMYLRNEYETIAEYNAAAGNIAEKYQFLVLADFPSNFTDLAIKRLQSIATSGARCGVYALIHWDTRLGSPDAGMVEILRKNSVCMASRGGNFVFAGKNLPGTKVTLDSQPDADIATGLVHKIGEASRDSSRVEVPFSHVAPGEADVWSQESTQELRVSIGRTGATKLQYVSIGRGTRQHALIAGKTGSGKSTLFHVMITNLALWYSPEQVEFYLVDFKKGVEFKCYASKRLPHARVVAIESDREFGLSVLERVDEELKRRGELFRKLGVQDVNGFKREGGGALPRTLLMIDEFQELFVEDDKISQEASLLLDRIVRQGRAFGIHVILGSQTLGGAYTVARTTLGQMVIRIALQCNEADAYLIMDDTNPAPRLLTRPGEGIYNDSAGALAGNSPFQTVWLPDDVRDQYLDKVLRREEKCEVKHPGPIVYEGDAPGSIVENKLLENLLKSRPATVPAAARTWLGSPNSIKGPTEAEFHRQGGNNLLIIGQRDEASLAMFTVGLLALSAQFPAGGVRFYALDSTPPGSQHRDYFEEIAAAVPHPLTLAKGGNFTEILAELNAELKKRIDGDHGAGEPAIFLFINGIQRFNKLRHEESFGFGSGDEAASPGQLLNEIICEGASVGIHVMAACDSYNNVNRFFGKKAFTEFEMRVLFQMSATDSSSICDNPKASTLGLHRALFYNEQEGYLETFRPYSLPDKDWIVQGLKKCAG